MEHNESTKRKTYGQPPEKTKGRSTTIPQLGYGNKWTKSVNISLRQKRAESIER